MDIKLKPKYYITTPIYFASGNLHIGHTYCTVACDAIARYMRMAGYDVFFLTGTDEHGQKIETNAAAAGLAPKKFVDGLVDGIKDLWKLMDISYDKFIRTTDPSHELSVQKIFTKLCEKGDIYKSKYVGKYCKPCESFWTESQLVDGMCPDCGRPTESAEEESYFFRLTKYAEPLRKLLKSGEFLEPDSRVNEMVNNFIDKGLQDLAVSRSSFKWGIPVPIDNGHIIYVWIDALSNYITALGYGSDDDSLYRKYWPADVHVVGKEIVRFHTIIWPAMLMALGEPLPKKVFGHGWIKINGGKMGKSFGNVVDPYVLASRYGVDALRYYLLSEMQFGSDGDYTSELLINKINNDLCNSFGNLTRRTLSMCEQNFDGRITNAGEAGEFDDDLISKINSLESKVKIEMDKLQIDKAVWHIFELIHRSNKYIDETKPWALAKAENGKPRLERVLYNLLEAIRVACILLLPYIRRGAASALEALGQDVPDEFGKLLSYGKVKKYSVTNIKGIYPRLDVEKELKALSEIAESKSVNKPESESVNKPESKSVNKPESKSVNKPETKPVNKSETKKETGKVSESENEATSEITIDDFGKCRLVVAEVIKCEKVEGADRLLKSTLNLGSEIREVVSGIALHYSPEDMVGRRVVLLENLAPRKIRGVLSRGMLLCASEKSEDGTERVVLLAPEKSVAPGTEIG